MRTPGAVALLRNRTPAPWAVVRRMSDDCQPTAYGAPAYMRSRIPAAPMPVPTHMVTIPYFRL